MAKIEYVTCPECGSYQMEQRLKSEDVVCIDCGNVVELKDIEAAGDERPDADAESSER